MVGFIVIRNVNKQAHEIIESVHESYRKLGIASELVDYVMENFDMVSLIAETDGAVGFYKNYGFNIKPIRKMESVNRYCCEYNF